MVFTRVRKIEKSDELTSFFSVRPHCTTSYLSILQKLVERIQVSLISDKNNGYFTRRRFHIYDNISLNSS